MLVTMFRVLKVYIRTGFTQNNVISLSLFFTADGPKSNSKLAARLSARHQ